MDDALVDDVVYRGIRGPGGRAEILVEDLAGRQLRRVPHIVRHSPVGTNWVVSAWRLCLVVGLRHGRIPTGE